MRAPHSNGRVREVKDPDWRPTTSAAFWPLPEGHPLVVCGRCSVPVPDTDRARQQHQRHHEQIDGHDAR